jgi:hypothetical protein
VAASAGAGAILAGIDHVAWNEGLIAQTWFRPALNGFSAFRLGRLDGVESQPATDGNAKVH